MTRKDIRDAYESVSPSKEQKEKMLDAILSAVPQDTSVRKDIVVMKKYTKKPAVIAAIITVMVFFMGCAVVFGLRDMELGEFTEQLPGETKQTYSVISVQGYTGSPAYKAAAEWREFKKSFDPDGMQRVAGTYHHFAAPETYDSYFCNTQAEVDKVDELCKKYNLKPHGKGWNILDAQKVFEAVGISGIEAQGTEADIDLQAGWCYADGTFGFRGGATFPGQKVGDILNVDCVRKGSFDISTDTIANIDSYDDWNYIMKDGTNLLIAASGDEVLMTADQDSYFMRVRFFADGLPKDLEEKQELLEAWAECFDFSIQPKDVNTVILDEAAKDYENMMKDLETSDDEMFHFANYKAYFDGNPTHKQFGHKYALADLNGDGCDELILTLEDGRMTDILTDNGTETSRLMTARRLSSVALMDGNEFYLAEDGTLINHITCGDCQRYSFFRLENGEYKLFDFVEYHAETKAWTRSQDGDETCEKDLTEAEAKKIIDSYKPMDLDFKPISEFPVD